MEHAAQSRKDAPPQAKPASHSESHPQHAEADAAHHQGGSAALSAYTKTTTSSAKTASPVGRPASTPPTEQEIAPGVIDLKAMDKFTLAQETIDFLDKHNKPHIHARFGKLAQGPIELHGEKDKREIREQKMPLKHPLFNRLSEFAPELEPCLIVSAKPGGPLTGHVGFMTGPALAQQLQSMPESFGMTGFHFRNQPTLENKIEKGVLLIELNVNDLTIASAFTASAHIKVVDDQFDFDGSATITVKDIAHGQLDFVRSSAGLITGSASLELTLPKNFSGKAEAKWDGRAITGEGNVAYQGEKLSGSVTLHLMERSKALEATEKKGLANISEAEPEAAPTKGKPKHVDYAVFGEGDLNFAFNEWLNGTAHAIVDPKGFVTLVGEIRPQKEITLFETHPKKPIGPKIEVKAEWGLPVVANVYIGASGQLFVFADVKCVFQNMVAKGDYSTDPEAMKAFSLEGTLNLSAAAGIMLRLELYAGLEILEHKIEAGGGLNGRAGILGYVLATPVLGYREKGNPGEDKKGEFYIKGAVEVAAQPFLGLSGDVFIRLRTPWWSPLSDRDWPWELGSKVWPMGGSIGFGAGIEYTFGSGLPPDISFGEVDFSADKLVGDLLDDSVANGPHDKPPKSSPWVEKNQGATQAPPPAPVPSKPPPPAAAKKGAAKPTKKSKGGGKSPAELKAEAIEQGVDSKTGKGGKVVKGGPKKEPYKSAHPPAKKSADKVPAKGKKDESKKDEKKKEPAPVKGQPGVAAVHKALAYAEKNGITLEELNKILHKITAHKEYGFKHLTAESAGEEWHVIDGSMPGKMIASVKKAAVEPEWAHQTRKTEVDEESHTLKFHLHNSFEELYIESKPMRLESFLDDLEKKPGAKKKIIQKLRTLTEELHKKEEEGKMGVKRGGEIADLLTKIADLLPQAEDGLKRPPTCINHQPREINTVDGPSVVGLFMKAAPLSIRKPGNVDWTGSEPREVNPLWKKVNDKRPKTYIRGHLLNHNLFGPGINANMTPIHRKTNGDMSRRVEEKVKDAVLNQNKVVSYGVKVIYESWGSKYKDKLKVKDQIKEEEFLATKLTLEAYEMKRKSGTKGDESAHWEKPKKNKPDESPLFKIDKMTLANLRFPD
jgi:hypothetical protein